MAATVYRYRFVGTTLTNVAKFVPGEVSVGDIAPAQYTDLTCDDTVKTDLDNYMLERGWGFDSTAPVTFVDQAVAADSPAQTLASATTVIDIAAATAPTAGQALVATGPTTATWQTPSGSSILVKTAQINITANTTTNQASFQDLLTLNITAAGAGFFCIFADGAVSNTNSNVNMRLRVLLDGVSIGGVQMRVAASNIAMGFGFNTRVAVAAGARVVKLQWATANNTMQCRPVANPDAESASLLVQEVTA